MLDPADSSAPAPPTPPRPRRWLRLSLRGLMIFLLLLGLGLGWFVQGVKTQRDVVAVLRRSRGGVVYNWRRLPSGIIDSRAKPSVPAWLVDRFGPDPFASVAVAMLGRDGTDADVAAVARLRRLVDFTSFSPKLTDATLAHLATWPSLRNVALARTRTRTTPASLATLRQARPPLTIR